jgi:DNA-binding MarR family transcriptional regulator
VTEHLNPTIDFFVRLRKIDDLDLKPRDVMVLWSVARQPGQMGQEIAKKIGYPTRSNIQDGIRRLLTGGYMEDRRVTHNQHTPSQYHLLAKGAALLDEIVPR